MTSCNLTKPESTYDSIRKAYKDLPPTDAALLATALVEAGRLANGVHDGQEFEWSPAQFQAMIDSTSREVAQIQEHFEGEKTKKAAKNAEEESVTLVVMLKPNMKAGEAVLGSREDLKVILGDLINEGVEYLYSPTDIGWQWTMERVNWSAQRAGELRRRVKFRAEFVEPHIAVELGPGGKRKVTKK